MTTGSWFWNAVWEFLPEINDFDKGITGQNLPPEVNAQLRDFMSLLSDKEPPELENPSFLVLAASQINREWNSKASEKFREKAASLVTDGVWSSKDLLDLFFPEFSFGGDSAATQEAFIRNKRTIHLESINPHPLKDPSRELVFTSNVLMTLPPQEYKARLTPELQKKVALVEQEEQKYWFDHPIFMGVDAQANEMIYGLKGLADTIAFEKAAGTIPSDSRMTVLLSLSLTHDGLKSIARDYLASELAGCEGLEDLDVFLFTEEDTLVLSDSLCKILGIENSKERISDVFGVDGRYGRHYSFLKAVVPLWSLTMNPEVKGTFKIDLDQVFPQKELKEQTGKTAFEHFQTALWGALGRDSKGREVELGMIAGALVNEKDIDQSIFTPDVPLPADDFELKGESRIFHKQHPMAVSTLAEMMTRYGQPGHPDGKTSCLSRVHVTGGTNGILCSSLRKNRPFTPGFIGRAEDQAYLLSVLTDREEPVMRYVHEPGLIMRHDKDAFAGDSIAAAKLGTWVADLLRILYFSYYADFLPGGIESVKEELDPFTGCFISSTPFTKVFLRLILKILESPQDSGTLLKLAEIQLMPFLRNEENAATVKEKWMHERDAWDMYYDALDRLEEGLNRNDPLIKKESDVIQARLQGCRIN